jgi:hypothetical protein
MELRNKIRYRLSADAVFTWEGSERNRLHGKGVTRDVSLAGTFILTPTSPPVGAMVELEIFLAPTSGVGQKVRIRTEAKVIRVEHSGTSEGFAAASQDFKLLFNSNGRDEFSVSSRKPSLDDEKVSDSAPVRDANATAISFSRHAPGNAGRLRG